MKWGGDQGIMGNALVWWWSQEKCALMEMTPMLHGDKTNATSRLNSTSQTKVSTESECSPGGIFTPKIKETR